MDTPRPLAIVDIDGVVADVRHRLHHLESWPKDWDAFFAAAPADPPIPEGVARVGALAADHEVVFLTGRPERCRVDTQRWLDRHGLGGGRLLMRPRDDRRPARLVKLEAVRRLGREAPVALVLDDDPDVVADLVAAGWPVELARWVPHPRLLRTAQEREGRT